MGFGYYDEESAIGKVYDRRLLTRLWKYVGPYWVQVAFAGFFMVCVAILELMPQLILRQAIDGQITQGRTDELGKLTLMFFASLAGIFVMRYGQAMLMAYVGQKTMMALRLDLFSHLQRMAIAFFDRNPVGRLVTRLTNDVQMLDQVLSQGIVQILTNLLMVSAIVVVLLVIDWRMALVMYIFVPLLVYAVRRFALSQREGFRDQRVWLARVNAYLNELITGVAVIQLFNRQGESGRRFDHRNSGVLDANLRVLFWYAVFEPTVILFGAVTTGVILWYGGGRVVQGTLTLGTMVLFIGYMSRFYWPIRELSERYTTLQSAMASAERVFGIIDEPEEVTDVADPVELAHVRGKIEFRNVWFAYHAENWVLRDVSFVIEPGEKVAIVGATGAGKSTMMAVLNRFYDVQRGEVLVDDVPIRRYRQRDLRRHVGLMLQDPFVYTDTIAENIRLRDPSIPLERVRLAAEAVGASTFIAQTPAGYETMLAERGGNLSTGQKQLIALARVAAFDPEIVLVMDEATASIDPETEAIIQRGIQRVTTGRTTIVIAHRLNTIRMVNRILVLHHGELVEEGTHETLVRRDGIYARLYELQYQGQGAG